MGCWNKEYVGIWKIYNDGSFQPRAEKTQSSGQKVDTRCHTILGVGPGVPDGPMLRGREKTKCIRLANVESEYHSKTKKKWRGLNVFKSTLCQPHRGWTNK